jgi:acid phosphatase
MADQAMPASPYLFSAVWVILMENHPRAALVSLSAPVPDPNIQSYYDNFATADNYSTALSPSLPNYIEMSCGCNAAHSSVTVADPSASTVRASSAGLFTETSLGGQLQAAAVPWRAYAQDSAAASTLKPCQLTNTGEYVSRHVPFVYFTDLVGTSKTMVSATCTNRVRVFGDVDAKTGDFYTDLAAGTYAYQWITPDLIADMHDGTIANGDAFLGKVIPDIQATAAYKAGGVIFVLWDEGSSTDGQLLFMAISPRAKKTHSMTAFTEANFLATIEDIFKLSRTGSAVGVTNMMELFN